MDGPFAVAAVLTLAVQLGQGSVNGTVRDEAAGRPIAGASVTLNDPERTTATDGTGAYRFDRIPAGPQHLTVGAVGYETRTVHALVPASGPLVINVSLQPDPIPLSGLEVRSAPAWRGLEPEEGQSFPERGMTMAAVRNHPLLAEPDALRALAGGEVVVAPEMPDGLHVRGGGADQVGFLLDGVPVLNPYHVAGTFGAWNPDALERVDLEAAAPSAALPGALSGLVMAETKVVREVLEAQGALSSTQARVTASGPLGKRGAGFLASWRSGFPGFVASPGEGSYLRTEVGDALAKFETPLMGGHLWVLGYEAENEVNAAARSSSATGAATGAPRHAFAWESLSLGVEWSVPLAESTFRLRSWSAGSKAAAQWISDGTGDSDVVSKRTDRAVEASIVKDRGGSRTTVGVRFERSDVRYGVPNPAGDPMDETQSATTTGSAFAQLDGTLGAKARFGVGASLTRAIGANHLSPRASVSWSPLSGWTLSTAWSRAHQFVQSVRNPESVARTIFPPDLWVGAGSAVPVARSDQFVVASEHRLGPGARLGLEGFSRRMTGLVMVAPVTGEPFSDGSFLTGTGDARGFSAELSLTAARYVALASYGWQRVRLEDGERMYAPEFGAAHTIEAGATAFPGTTWSVRGGVTALFGRRGTPTRGAFEWESCNLIDLGCEFSGSPIQEYTHLGTDRLPAYVRLDLGARKHWHVRIARRDVRVGLYGTVTNVLGRRNVFTYVADPTTGSREPIELRPMAPLVIGMDWRF